MTAVTREWGAVAALHGSCALLFAIIFNVSYQLPSPKPYQLSFTITVD